MCAHVVWLTYSTVCMYIHVLLTYTCIYIQLLKYLLYFATNCRLISIPPYEPTYIYNIELLYIGAQHPYHTQLCSIDTRRYHRTSVLTAVGCVRRDPDQIFILVYAVYNNTCYTDIVDVQQPTYATIASSIYNNIHIYLYTQIQSYTRSHAA